MPRNPAHVDALRAIADRRAPAIRRAFVDAVAAAQGGELRRRLQAALDRGALQDAYRIADEAFRTIAEADLQVRIAETLLDRLQQAGKVTEREIERVTRTFRAARGIESTIRFDVVNERAVRWARERSAGLVRDITADQRQVLQQVMGRVSAGELPTRQAIREIERTVGLLPQHEAAAASFRRELQALAGREGIGSLKLRTGRVSNRGLTDTKIDARVQAYRDRLLRQRATLIARTESMAAANQGQLEAWLQAREKGQIPPSMFKTWIIAGDERTCPICLSVDGQTVPLEAPFNTPVGPRMMPPAHPACRCSTGLTEGRWRRVAA